MTTGKLYTPEETTLAVKLYQEGKTTRQIAQELKRTAVSMKSYIANHREKFPPRNNSGLTARSKVLHALQTQPNLISAASLLGWNTITVDRWARLFVKTGELISMPEGSIYRRNYLLDPDFSELTKHLANRLWKYRGRDKYKADERHKQFNLDAIWIENQLKRQNNRCYYSGVEFSTDATSRMYITIDRLNSNLGYNQDNCVLCCQAINISKHTMTKDKFILMCHAVARTHPL